MAHKWTQKALIAECLQDAWSTTSDTTMLAKMIGWINEIQDDLVSKITIPHYRITIKKLLPTSQSVINLSPELPGAPTVVIASGGSLTNGNSYKVHVTFIVWDEDTKRYIESEKGTASTAVVATSVNKTITVTAIPTYSGTATVEPITIYRRLYVSQLVSGETDYGEPFFSADVEDNTTTTATITAVPTSTITPPSDTEIDHITDETMVFADASGFLTEIDRADIRKFTPSTTGTSATPRQFAFEGVDSIFLYPQLVSTATTAQRTLIYVAQRRPHEVFNDATRPMDLPITWKNALKAGVVWKVWSHRDREGFVTKLNTFEKLKQDLIIKNARTKGRPGSVVDVNGDIDSMSVE